MQHAAVCRSGADFSWEPWVLLYGHQARASTQPCVGATRVQAEGSTQQAWGSRGDQVRIQGI